MTWRDLAIGGFRIVSKKWTDQYENCSLKKSVRLNDVFTDVINRGIGVRKGESLSPSPYRVFLTDLKNYVNTQFASANLSTLSYFGLNDQEETWTLPQMFVLLCFDDTQLLSENAGDMQNALDEAVTYSEMYRMSLNIEKTKYMICSRG